MLNIIYIHLELEEIYDSSDDENSKTTSKEKHLDKNELASKVNRRREEKIPDDVPLIFVGVKVKEEPIDEPGNINLLI